MRRYILLSILLLFSERSFGQLQFKNNGTSDVLLVIGYYSESDTFTGWITEGWYRIKSSEKKCVYGRPLNARYYYYYGFSVDSLHKEYSGNNRLVVEREPFKLLNADKDSITIMDRRKYFYKRFRLIDTQGKRIFTVTLQGRQDVNSMPKDSVLIFDSIKTTPSIIEPR